jgi:lipopolysaccharide/colanic/teichoic acid biosynthesis glycosyltransferase
MEAGSFVYQSAVVIEERESRATAIACRALDMLAAAVVLLLLSPLLLVIVIAIQLDSPGWAIYRQERFGRRLEPFTLNKFRTMRAGADHETHRAFVIDLITGVEETESRGQPGLFKLGSTDERITRLGCWLRRSSMDELPQLWNVLRGEMSLVGPRPPVSYEIEHYPVTAFGRFAVKPGLTGLWQVSGRSQTTFDEMIRLDLEYARRRSLWLNLQILARTVPVVLRGKGAA